MNVRMKIIGVVIFSAFIYGCLPDPLDVKNVPVLQPHIVVSSQVVPGQSIAVLLTRSISALDAGSSTNADTLLTNVVLNDAVVTVTYLNKTDTLTFRGTGVYTTSTTPLTTGVSYTLNVNSPSMGKVTSTTKMNAQVPFDSVTASLLIVNKDTLGNIHYRFTDPAGPNWYMIDVQRFRNPKNLQNNLNPRIFIKPLSDETFDGQVKSETFTVPFRRFHEGDTVAVVLANISEDYYHYLQDRIDGQDDISEFVSEPLNLPTNVTGGYGYFNMQIPDVRVFKLK